MFKGSWRLQVGGILTICSLKHGLLSCPKSMKVVNLGSLRVQVLPPSYLVASLILSPLAICIISESYPSFAVPVLSGSTGCSRHSDQNPFFHRWFSCLVWLEE